jgi:serine/threonine protein kinase
LESERWLRVEDLYHRALEIDAAARSEFLRFTCGDDTAIRSEVESLLAYEGAASTFIESSALEVAGKLLARDMTETGDAANLDIRDRVIGPYHLIEKIGEGGMGEVWLADQSHPLRRRVALKLVKAGMDTREVTSRFETERQALALMDHPAVARVLDGGSTSSGRPYFVMEYVPGIAITDWCNRHRFSVTERLGLFVQVCEGVKHAHQKAIIHRDLKPSNILVIEVDGRATPKIIDFGVAKAVQQKPDEKTLFTRAGTILGTPEYMSPEQANSAGGDVDTRSDVYSLGVILYQLLVGSVPIDLSKLTFPEMIRKLSDADPLLPSRRVRTLGEESATICKERRTEPRTLERQLRGDLDSIVMKALEKQRNRRYSGPAELAQDIGRYLGREPVTARPQHSWYRASKFIQRHRLAAGAVASVALALGGGFGAALWEAHVARTQAQVASREAQTSAAVEQFITDIFETNSRDQKDPLKARETTARQLLDTGARKIETGLDKAPAAKERMLHTLADLYIGLGLDDEAVALSQKRVTMARALYGPNDARVAAALTYLAASMHLSKSVKGREAVLLEAKGILDRNRDFDSPLRGRLLYDLAEHYTTWDSKKALDYATQSVTLFRRLSPSLDLEAALYYQGWAYSLLQDFANAETAYRDCLSVALRVGLPKAQLPQIETGLADAGAKLSHFEDAKRNFELAFDTARAVNGASHVDAMETEARLGEFLSATSQYTEGVSHLSNALSVCLKLRGPDDSFFTPHILLLYGQALADSGHFEEGLGSISKAVENRRKNRPGTRYLGQMLVAQASALADLGEYQKAKLALDETEALSKQAGFKLTSAYAAARLKLAFDLHKPEEAVTVIESFYGPAPATASAAADQLDNLTARAKLALSANRPEEALRLATRVSDAIAASPYRRYLRKWEARASLAQGSACLQLRRSQPALDFLTRADRLARDIYDTTSAELIPARATLGLAFWQAGNHQEAMKLLLQADSLRNSHPRLGERFSGPLRELRQNVAANRAIVISRSVESKR